MQSAIFLLLLSMCTALAQNSLIITAWYPQNNFGGGNMFIRGDFAPLSWDEGLEMTLVGVDQWQIQLPISNYTAGSQLAFKILINDAVWMQGGNAQVVLPTPAAGSANEYIYSYSIFPWFGNQNGNFEYTYGIYSPQLGNTRDIVVYLPPSYHENPYKTFQPRDVLIMHDGQNLFNASTSTFGTAWMCQDTVDSLVADGDMREIIIVGVDNTDNRTYELTYSVDASVGTGGGLDLYLDFVEQTVLPLMQTKYRIVPAAAGYKWAMLGSSLGGLASCYAGWTRSDRYWFVGCMSSSFWWNNQDFNNTIMMKRDPNGPYPPLISAYLDSGNAGIDDDDVNQTLTVRAHFQSLGFPLSQTVSLTSRSLGYYLDQGGQHSEAYWGARFHVPMSFAYPVIADSAVPI